MTDRPESQGEQTLRLARERQAAKVAAAGGPEAYRAQAAERQLRADAWRRAEAAQAEVAAAEQRLVTAKLAAQQAIDTAEGLWALSLGPVGRTVRASYGGAYETAAAAAAEAEYQRANGRGASIARPYCGHGWDDRLTAADSPCRSCERSRK